MRLGFAIAAFLEADVLLLDEVFAVGDESFQRKCFGVIAAFKERGGTILFVSHDASAVERLCDRAVLLRDGRARLRRSGPRGDHALPPRARRGGRRRRRRTATARPAPARRASPRRGSWPPTGSRATGSSRGSRSASTSRSSGSVAAPQPAPRGPGRLRAPRRRGRRRDRVARLGRPRATASRSASTSKRRRSSSAGSSSRSPCSATTAACSTGCRDPIPLLVYPDDESRGLVRLEGTWRRGPKEAEL